MAPSLFIRAAFAAGLAGCALSLSACDAPDRAALAKGDAVFKGQVVDGALTAVASRPVMVGNEGPRSPACPARATLRGDSVAIRWAPDAASPTKADHDDDVWLCETRDGWAGVVFPASGQSMDACRVTISVRPAQEYQGPCRWGWVEADKISRTAG
ncbi:MAG: hypothetical protein MUF41_00235 [Sphingopyxis sp.]|jgi:hypothetical protein|nr:hypothetical protein [Sphingopyxis sp.]